LSGILYNFRSFEIYELTLDGSAKRILGNGERRIINEYVHDTVASPRRAIVREIVLEAAN
jgi:hypothetical protein